MTITCCKECVPPKRYPGCHGSCEEYIAQRTEYKRMKDAYAQKERIARTICGERSVKVFKALKDRKRR